MAVTHAEFDREARHQFEARHRAVGALLRQREELERSVRRWDPDEGSLDALRRRIELEHRGGDDAERAFGADEQVFEVVAGVVLLELVEEVHHAAVGEHDLDAHHEIAGDAVGHRIGAAGIGREIAADGATALGGERERKQPVDGSCRLLRLDEHDARFAGHGVRGRVDLADAVEPGQRQHHLAVERNLAADETGVAALRHDRGRRLVGELEDRRDLIDRAGTQHQRRAAVIEPAALDEEGLLRARIGDGVASADDRGEARDQFGRQRRADMGVHGANIVDFVAMKC